MLKPAEVAEQLNIGYANECCTCRRKAAYLPSYTRGSEAVHPESQRSEAGCSCSRAT